MKPITQHELASLFAAMENVAARNAVAEPFGSTSGVTKQLHLLQECYETTGATNAFYSPARLTIDSNFIISEIDSGLSFLGYDTAAVLGHHLKHFLAAASIRDFANALPSQPFYLHLVDSVRNVVTVLCDPSHRFTLMIPDVNCPDEMVRRLYGDLVLQICGHSVRDLQLLQHVHDYILMHTTKPLPSSSQLAKMFFTNEQKLKELFRVMVGTSVYKFYNRTRLNHAHHLIENTQLPLVDIALICGFSRFRHFAGVFQKEFGYTAGDIRRRC